MITPIKIIKTPINL